MIVSRGADAATRILIIPPLFDEHNKLRRQLMEIMRQFEGAGIGTVLPDLPGWNESTEPLEDQSLASWRSALSDAARINGVTHFLAVRSGALVAPGQLSGWNYSAQTGERLLRGLIRARTITSREAGRDETSESLYEMGRRAGLVLAGWKLGAQLFRDLETAQPSASENISQIDQATIGGPGLWLRAEPGEDAAQADALVKAVLSDLERTT